MASAQGTQLQVVLFQDYALTKGPTCTYSEYERAYQTPDLCLVSPAPPIDPNDVIESP